MQNNGGLRVNYKLKFESLLYERLLVGKALARFGSILGWNPDIRQKNINDNLKGQCHEIFDFRFFHESLSPKPLSIPLGPFQIFLKILGDIHSSRCTTGVVDIGGKWKKSSIRKVLLFFLDTFG